MPDRSSPTEPAAPERLIAIIPVGALDDAKSRLGAVLDAEERLELSLRLARRTITAALAATSLDDVFVITPDDTVRDLARDLGARPILQRDRGLNRGIEAARDEAVADGATAVLIVPVDLPEISAGALDDIAATLADSVRPLVALVADRHGRGTNALLIAPPDAIAVCFGGDSAVTHRAAARARGAALVELDGPLRLDLDTPDDLLLAEATLRDAERVHAD
mgnify:CR=1 FL=1